MPRCTHKGCGQEFDDQANADDSCIYHSGVPVFHEGLKSWSCCDAVNKPVLDFDDFMRIPGCTRGKHTTAEPAKPDLAKPTVKSANETPRLTESIDGKETYSSSQTPSAAVSKPRAVAESSKPPTPAPPVEEEDDLEIEVPAGTTCRRNGCKVAFVSEEENRKGEGPGAVCVYHPAAPIFHEGSKGYFCCKRRVLEFDEFLKIEGCKQGRHLFIPKSKRQTQSFHRQTEELVTCRIDHYQTQTAVNVTVYAKQADKDRSSVKLEENQIHLDLYLPNSKRFTRSVELFGPIDASASTVRYDNTKVTLVLKKLDGRSWALLERTDRDLGGIALTFGVGGRTGTIGAKELVLDDQNSMKKVV
ncbi:chord-domain-containing protein [Artomyces pyxidatus]|uniref:Chord-domain-containing protein n=1 Tax=Artomyces pyxidatus TaxID=48021 RepID=A0ACB8T983_9AGAM|nr:chord-domain-containing protein [Artomyces pyxidatus]